MGADMTFNETNNRIAEFQEKIASLPIGSITKKTVNGKTYFYHRFTENKKRREEFIPAQDLDALKAKIDLSCKLRVNSATNCPPDILIVRPFAPASMQSANKDLPHPAGP